MPRVETEDESAVLCFFLYMSLLQEGEVNSSDLADPMIMAIMYGSQIVAKFNIKNLYQNQQLDT